MTAAAESPGQNNALLVAILTCEIGFWVVLLAGLVARYPLRRPRLGGFLLAAVPVVDLALVAFSAIDLHTGGSPGLAHSLAAAYLGVSVAFGPDLVRRMDARFAHRYADGPPPPKPPRHGPEKIRYEWALWGRCALAMVLSAALTLVLFLLAGPQSTALALWNFQIQLAVITVAWLLFGPVRVSVFSAKEPLDIDEKGSGT
ncbi:hypothetical protein LY13_002484 [Prauserella aidingensis]|nr:hypothetical protein [Prauserella aidingensis]